MAKSITIQKNPVLNDSSNYELLRKAGYAYIEELGSKLWTDYNIHDPGITILEALCYALTDLGYRTSLDIKDLLALPVKETADADGQFPEDKRQAFFTARNILTVNPQTTDDFRKLLININGIKNGWLHGKQCPCDDMYLYANCTKSVLQYQPTDHTVIIKGLYDVLVEFEEEDKSGNLNSGKIKYNFGFPNGVQLAKATVELRLPSWAMLEQDTAKYKKLRKPTSEITAVQVPFISGSTPVIADIPASPEIVLDNALRKPLFANIEVTFKPNKAQPATETIVFENVAMNIWFRSTEERRALELNQLKKVIEDVTAAGILPKYLEKIKRADAVMALAVEDLHNHRNLAEDFCSIKAIEVEDIGICADMEVEPNADMEAILAEAYYRIDQYMSPDIKFYSLQQLLAAGKTVDEIFNGPALDNGFIDNNELSAASLRTVLYTSDVINLVMDIPGVKALKNFVFTRYDDNGRLVESQPWSMNVSFNHQPRLYILASKVLLFKNGLPFLPDANELSDTMQVIKGQHAQPKFSVLENDLPVPHGSYFNMESYFAVQNSLPLTYGIGPDGLPAPASRLRKAQAKQLKAYLLFFEQLLVNYLSQLANIKDLFAVDDTVDKTYFSRLLQESEIGGLSDLYAVPDADALQTLVETEDMFLDRRNRFLDHLLARFAESFNDYALMLYSYTGDKQIAESSLIENKISFIKQFPVLSHDRGKAFNYKNPGLVCNDDNVAGLVKRIRVLLGYGTSYSSYFEIYEVNEASEGQFDFRWRLVDEDNNILLSSPGKYSDADQTKAIKKAKAEIEEVFKYMDTSAQYKIKQVTKFVLSLVNEDDIVIATRKQNFNTEADAEVARDVIIAFKATILSAEKIYLVEHLLLRPRNKPAPASPFTNGDPMLPVCLDESCNDCDERDPYSFRITIVLNGEEGLANKGIEFRRFAEQTIRMETPAHLGLKICWVSKEELATFGELYCSWLAELAKAEPARAPLHNKLTALLNAFKNLNSVYPPATLHDCVDGNDDNRVYLGHTAIIGNAALDKLIEKKKEN